MPEETAHIGISLSISCQFGNFVIGKLLTNPIFIDFFHLFQKVVRKSMAVLYPLPPAMKRFVCLFNPLCTNGFSHSGFIQ